MQLLPHKSEMVVLPFSGEELRFRLYGIVYPVVDGQPMKKKEEKEFAFNGVVKDNTFRISRKVKHSDSFLPLVKGYCEDTRKGCILHLEYELFPATRLFLYFWLFVATSLAVVFFLEREYLLGGGALLAAAASFIVASVMFKRRLRESRAALSTIFS